MDEKNDSAEKFMDDFMLPGFRFHPTDEELVGFYLKRKLQQRTLPIELIKQVDIYKYDPWDLPKLASTGEKEWYFYCPRDRKYRNSARPNRVTGSGFWKATGTDRPIYASDGAKCIGLKKSLVFYRGRAAKGIKTDWMMHEFRLPTSTDAVQTMPKKVLDKNLPLTDSWAICRIFKKTNSMAQRALSHSWASASLSESSPQELFTYNPNLSHFNSENISSTTEADFHHSNFSALNIPAYKTTTTTTVAGKPSFLTSPNTDYFPAGNPYLSSPEEISAAACNKTTADLTSMMFFNTEGPHQQQFNNGFSTNSSSLIMQQSVNDEDDHQEGFRKNNQSGGVNIDVQNPWGSIRSMGFPFSLPATANPPWDSPPCPSEISSSTYNSTNKCYT